MHPSLAGYSHTSVSQNSQQVVDRTHDESGAQTNGEDETLSFDDGCSGHDTKTGRRSSRDDRNTSGENFVDRTSVQDESCKRKTSGVCRSVHEDTPARDVKFVQRSSAHDDRAHFVRVSSPHSTISFASERRNRISASNHSNGPRASVRHTITRIKTSLMNQTNPFKL